MPAGLAGFLGLGLGLGLVHALDADHLLAVSSFSVKQQKARSAWRFCLRWSLGHTAALLAVAGAVLIAGAAIPVTWAGYAERAVGGLMILLGIWVLRDRQRMHWHFHTRDGLPGHAHRHDCDRRTAPHHRHGAVLVGALHGLAGSAPLLMLVPMGQLAHEWYGLLYMTVFSIGVLLAMLGFGAALGRVLYWSTGRNSGWERGLRGLFGFGGIIVGAHLLSGVA